MAAGPAIVACDGLLVRGAESLAVRAGGLVFTGALDAGILGRRILAASGEEAAAVIEAAGRVLSAAGCGADGVGKTKLVLSAMEDAPDALAAVARHWPAAATAAVGARLPDPRAGLAVSCVGVPGGHPRPFRDERGRLVATRLGDLVFTAGCGAPAAEEAPAAAGDLPAQGRLALAALRAALAQAGLTPAALVKVNNTTACWHDYRLYNAAYKEGLPGTNAARCSVSGSLRHPLSLIEVEGVAAAGEPPRFVDSTRSGVGRGDFTPRPDTLYRPDLGPCKGPHSHGARAGDIVFVAGECPYDASDRLVGAGDVAAQTLRTLENVRLSLEALGAGLVDVVKTTVTLADARLAPAFEAAYASVFSAPYPARTLVATPLGQYGILVEIEAVAVVGAGRNRLAVVGRTSA